MLTHIAGYHIGEKIHESPNSLVWRGRREADDKPVVLKMLSQLYPPPEKIAWFKREHEITYSLNPSINSDQALAGVIEAYSLEVIEQQWVMALEDFGGQSLRQLRVAGNLDLADFLKLAIKVTEILGQIHQRQIMHKDINPANIVWNPTTNQVKLIDFGISTALSRENPTFHNPNVLEGTLAYISPEQTGRMNRAVDYRTDFYSLGVTFYELLTGQLPFPTTDPMELVHAHIAKDPPSPRKLKPNLPQLLSNLLLKLMAKNAEARYQSAYGLKVDLEKCLQQWESSNHIETFPLGQSDVSDRFQIPQKLYGREHEIESLLAAFNQVVTGPKASQDVLQNGQSKIEMMLITGYTGIGKSALVQEVYKPITAQRGYFIAGHFDEFQRNIPYTSFIQAFQSLIRQLLIESPAEIAVWQEKLLTALGANGQILIELIPDIELIIGPQPEIAELGSIESQNRFNLVWQNFIKVFAQPEHPLVIFLDDLQWADGASLKLIELLMTTLGDASLFLIGAYRDSDVDKGHPLTLTLTNIQKAKAAVSHIFLSPLEASHITHLLSDTLNAPGEQLTPLTELVLTKTDGNPFFLTEFLKSLYTEALISFDHKQGQWQWNLEQIQAQNITDNVVELLADKVKQLQGQAQTVLKLAACIGDQFDLETLAIVYEKSPKETAIDLWSGITEGHIVPLDDAYKLMDLDVQGLTDEVIATYKFTHDRVQQAVYSLISQEEKQVIHQQIGQLLLEKTPPDKYEKRLFDIVNHLNHGRSLIKTQPERDELARLNLLAGQKAKASVAYDPAFNYLQVGINLLAPSPNKEESWQRQYDLALALHVEATEVAYLNGNYDQMERLAERPLHHAKLTLDKTQVYDIKIQAYVAQKKLQETVKFVVPILNQLGLKVSEKPGKLQIAMELMRVKLALAGKQVEDLIDLPEMIHPNVLAVESLMSSAGPAIYATDPELLVQIIIKYTRLTIKYGNFYRSSITYAAYGMLLCGAVGDIDTGYRFGQLALKILDRFEAKTVKARTSLVVDAMIRHWKEPIRASLKPLLEGYQSGLETGDLEYGHLCLLNYGTLSYIAGINLADLHQEMTRHAEAIKQASQNQVLHMNQLYRQAMLNLFGQSDNPHELAGPIYYEKEMLPFYLETNDRNSLCNLYLNKLILCYMFQAYPQAVECAALAEEYLDGAPGTIIPSVFHFYDSLAQLALFPQANQSEQKRMLKKVTANQKKIKNWAAYAPMNQQHRFYLVEAERARLLGNEGDAREYYDQAIALAQENNYINIEALAYELAGKFYLAKGVTYFAQVCFRNAHYAYQRWGATAKVKDLEKNYQQLTVQSISHISQGALTTTTTGSKSINSQTSNTLDLTSVIKASQTISGEIVQDKLLAKLMKIVVENAGAQTGYLIIEKAEQWIIAAQRKTGQDEVAVLQSTPALPSTASDEHQSLVPAAIINYVVHTQENVVLNDATHEGQFTRDPYIINKQPKSILCTPLLNQGKLTGILYLENNLITGAFTPGRLTVLNLLSSQAAISIENATLYSNLDANEKKYRTLFEDSKDTIFISEVNGRLTDVNSAGLKLFGYTRAEIMQVNILDLYVNLADRHKIIKEIEQHSAVKDIEVQLTKKDGSIIDCLMSATIRQAEDGTVLGYQGIIRDITALKRAEQERLRLTSIERELTLAQEIHQSLLPPSNPGWSNLDVVCYSSPAREMGGDFYAYYAFDVADTLLSFETSGEQPDQYALAVGDVTGKGMPAALLMAISLSSFRAIVGQDMTPAELLTQMNNTLIDYTHTTRQNCALVYVEIVPPLAGQQEGHMHVANAGCITPIIRPMDGPVKWIDVGGMPLGVGLGTELGYQDVSLSVAKGDLIILTSDGVVEANNADSEMFSFERLEQAVATGPTTSAQAMLFHLQTEVEAFVGETEPHDDLTIVVIQV